MTEFERMAANPGYLQKRRDVHHRATAGTSLSVTALAKCPCCLKRRSVGQFKKAGGACEQCRRKAIGA